jgi:hypothetical protein
MKYTGTHRNVEFSVPCENGAWTYAINKECFGLYSEREHAIHAAVRHIDRILFEATRSGGQ